jgi:hypothetical protein
MKLGKGHNEYHLNTATMVAILNEHLKYSTDQVVTGFRYVGSSSSATFVVTLEDKRPEEKAV